MDHLFFVVHTHWDREWYQPFQQMRARLVAMTDRMLPLVESGKLPHFHFDGQTIVLDDYLEIRPRNRARVAKLIKAGKIAVGPWYVLDLHLEVGRLEDYLKRLSEAPLEGVPAHRGELRSPARAHLLPGVTSARTWIKQRDFANCALLERYADPLAALANAHGRGEGLGDFLEQAWRTEIQNHPHDSICGCSVDQVHEDMRYRFDQAAMLGETVVRNASKALLDGGEGAPMLAVFNPTFAREGVASGEVELAAGAHSVLDSLGNRLPLAVEARGRRALLTFVASDLAQAGFSFYRLVSDAQPAQETVQQPPSHIENEAYRVEPGAAGFEILDKTSGQRLELYFEDDGDRGDEYNFDPVGDGAAISEPRSISVEKIETSPVRSRMQLRLDYEIPAALASGRASRSPDSRSLTVILTATLYAGLRRIDFTAEVQNCSQDHRLRVALRTPVRTREAVSDTSFGMVGRPLEAAEPRGTEVIYPTFPHRSVTMIESEALSVALASRGLYEVEARPEQEGTTLLLTLLRCVGWLSRSDLATRDGGAGPELATPGAQELGAHTFQFAISTYRGSYLEADVMSQIVTFVFPSRVFAAREPVPPVASLQLFSCDNSRVMFSTARPADRTNAYVARAFSISPNSETATFSFGEGRRGERVDLAVRRLHVAGTDRQRGSEVTVNLRPFEIVTFKVVSKRPRKKISAG